MAIKLKRAYEPPEAGDGARYLVERLWPRGVKKEALELTDWLKELAPSTELRKWYDHKPERRPEFTRRYREELSAPDAWAAVERLAEESQSHAVTLVFSTHDVELSGAGYLAQVIEELHQQK
jgi:uncharacterized protein YeaO (DUF488 family)